MYYDFSFCADVSSYKKELDVLDYVFSHNGVFAPNSETMPFSFSLSKSRHIVGNFENLKLYSMFLAYETEMRRFFETILSFEPIDNNFISFISKNKKQKDPWYEACLYFIAAFYSDTINSFDGPYPENIDKDSMTKHLKRLQSVMKRKLTFTYNEPDAYQDYICFYEFPNDVEDLKKGSIIIDNKYHKNLDLLFEDKLKIYGV